MDEKQKLSKFEILRISFLCFALAVYFTIWLTSSEGVSNVVLFNTLVILQYLSFSAVFIAEILNCSKKKEKILLLYHNSPAFCGSCRDLHPQSDLLDELSARIAFRRSFPSFICALQTSRHYPGIILPPIHIMNLQTTQSGFFSRNPSFAG